MSTRRSTAVASTATPYATGPLPEIRRAPRLTASVVPEQAPGSRSTGGSLGSVFTLPGFDAGGISFQGSAALPETPTAAASDCCG